MITGKFSDQEDFQNKLEQALHAVPRVVQLRCRGISGATYLALARLAQPIY